LVLISVLGGDLRDAGVVGCVRLLAVARVPSLAVTRVGSLAVTRIRLFTVSRIVGCGVLLAVWGGVGGDACLLCGCVCGGGLRGD